jgi:hypothetical protein
MIMTNRHLVEAEGSDAPLMLLMQSLTDPGTMKQRLPRQQLQWQVLLLLLLLMPPHSCRQPGCLSHQRMAVPQQRRLLLLHPWQKLRQQQNQLKQSW